ncbi:hypothetical protein DIPPA_24853 [Diplonema papillatum]|nr:hypothetical protein DIPPA_24853 [Diplonema papillatum]
MSSVAALRHTIGEQSALAGQCLHNGDFDQARDLIAQTRDSLAAAEAAARAAAESAGAGADGLVPRWISDKRAECYVREALFAQRAGAAGKACGLLLKAEELNPDCGTVHINLISVLEHLGARHEQILSRAKRAIVVLEERVRDDSLDDASRQGTNELLALAYLKYAGALESHVKEDIESEVLLFDPPHARQHDAHEALVAILDRAGRDDGGLSGLAAFPDVPGEHDDDNNTMYHLWRHIHPSSTGTVSSSPSWKAGGGRILCSWNYESGEEV